jgi:light-regulated signal transduction histidine kinase (bacteriophytochrome)
MQELRERMASEEKTTQRFLEVLIHDVRAHQRGINTVAELLGSGLDGNLSEDNRHLLSQLQDRVTKTNTFLAAVGNYAETLPGAHYSFRSLPIETPIQAALSQLETMVSETGARVSYSGLPQVWGDLTRLTALFRHLIANALAYRGAAEPRVEILARAEGTEWIVSVADNGIGIAPNYWERLFVPFFRLHGPEIPGAGLGLAACKNIVERHGGKIWLASKVCEGSTFFFSLPRAPGAEE